MKKLQALTALRDKVKAGETPRTATCLSAFRQENGEIQYIPGGCQFAIKDAHKGSLDAAKDLHEAVLPGWWWETDGPKIWRVWHQGEEEYLFHEASIGVNPARAWLLAILEALIAQEGRG